jgi:hypothetical protein
MLLALVSEMLECSQAYAQTIDVSSSRTAHVQNFYFRFLSSILANPLRASVGCLLAYHLDVVAARSTGNIMDMAYHDIMLGGGIIQDVL